MVEITKRVHTIDGSIYPFPGGKFVPYMFVENSDDLTLIDPYSFHNYQYLRIIYLMQDMISKK